MREGESRSSLSKKRGKKERVGKGAVGQEAREKAGAKEGGKARERAAQRVNDRRLKCPQRD